MAAMRLRLDPADEYMHPLETASNFNETSKFKWFTKAGLKTDDRGSSGWRPPCTTIA